MCPLYNPARQAPPSKVAAHVVEGPQDDAGTSHGQRLGQVHVLTRPRLREEREQALPPLVRQAVPPRLALGHIDVEQVAGQGLQQGCGPGQQAQHGLPGRERGRRRAGLAKEPELCPGRSGACVLTWTGCR